MYLGLKIDVDTDRGTRIGVTNLLKLFEELNIRATFLFSLGPDNTGRAIRRVFRPGFLKKVQRTNVVSVYGWQTLLNGVLWPGPHIGRRHTEQLKNVAKAGHEVGIHCYDHNRWQDKLATMTEAEVFQEFALAFAEFQRIFSTPAKTAGAAGWQANAHSLAAYDAAQLKYASDARGTSPFYPRVGDKIFHTLQLPTTLPTLDEWMGHDDIPRSTWITRYVNALNPDGLNILTLHAEIEGMAELPWFREFLTTLLQQGVKIVPVAEIAESYLQFPHNIPVCDLLAGEMPGRSGTLAMQGDLT